MRLLLRTPDGSLRRAATRMLGLPAIGGGLLACALALLAAGPPAPAAGAVAQWPTYHRDGARSGADPDASEPVEPFFDWHSPDLGAPILGQPLLLGNRVYVATVGDRLDALDATTGQILWSHSLGAAVPAGALPCGNVSPTVGVVGTPVIDVAAGVIYAVADTWNASTEEARHVLVGVALATGEEVLRTPVDPPGADPKALLQRTALNLSEGHVIFGFGGNDGDCGPYRGAVAAVPQDGGAASFWQVPIHAPATSGGGVWATPGPAVDGAGHIFATTGNPNPPEGQESTVYDESDSVIELGGPLASLSSLGTFSTLNWRKEGNEDLDLASAGPEPLPGGLVFQAGKTGVGYLIEPAAMAAHEPAVFSHGVCGGHSSFGGDAYAGGVIYIPCTNGVQALAYDQAARTFTPMWKGPPDAFGSPIVSAGLVWSAATGGFAGGGTKLYGLDPASGAPRYTLTLPSPIADHFASPSAGGGRLFIATGSSVTAYRVARLTASGEEPPAGAPGGATSGTTGGGARPRSAPPIHTTLAATRAVLLRRSLFADARGHVRLMLRCKPTRRICRGTLALLVRVPFAGRAAVGRTPAGGHSVVVVLAGGRYGPARGDFTVTLRLGPRTRAQLRRRAAPMALTVTIVSPGGARRSFTATLGRA